MMNRNDLIKNILPKTVNTTPNGFPLEDLKDEQFELLSTCFFDKILEICQADISQVKGYGEFDEKGETSYKTFNVFLEGTFSEENPGYWQNWREMLITYH